MDSIMYANYQISIATIDFNYLKIGFN